MNKLFANFDGELYSWISVAMLLIRYRDSNTVAHNREFGDALKKVQDACRAAREDGANWLWTEKNIERDAGQFTLPSVDMTAFFDIEGNGAFEKYMTDKGFGPLAKKVSWDTERSAWYPRFKTLKDAVSVIYAVNSLFDEAYLKA